MIEIEIREDFVFFNILGQTGERKEGESMKVLAESEQVRVYLDEENGLLVRAAKTAAGAAGIRREMATAEMTRAAAEEVDEVLGKIRSFLQPKLREKEKYLRQAQDQASVHGERARSQYAKIDLMLRECEITESRAFYLRRKVHDEMEIFADNAKDLVKTCTDHCERLEQLIKKFKDADRKFFRAVFPERVKDATKARVQEVFSDVSKSSASAPAQEKFSDAETRENFADAEVQEFFPDAEVRAYYHLDREHLDDYVPLAKLVAARPDWYTGMKVLLDVLKVHLLTAMQCMSLKWSPGNFLVNMATQHAVLCDYGRVRLNVDLAEFEEKVLPEDVEAWREILEFFRGWVEPEDAAQKWLENLELDLEDLKEKRTIYQLAHNVAYLARLLERGPAQNFRYKLGEEWHEVTRVDERTENLREWYDSGEWPGQIGNLAKETRQIVYKQLQVPQANPSAEWILKKPHEPWYAEALNPAQPMVKTSAVPLALEAGKFRAAADTPLSVEIALSLPNLEKLMREDLATLYEVIGQHRREGRIALTLCEAAGQGHVLGGRTNFLPQDLMTENLREKLLNYNSVSDQRQIGYALFAAAYLSETYEQKIGLPSYYFLLTNGFMEEKLDAAEIEKVYGAEVWDVARAHGFSELNLFTIVTDLQKRTNAYVLVENLQVARFYARYFGAEKVLVVPNDEKTAIYLKSAFRLMRDMIAALEGWEDLTTIVMERAESYSLRDLLNKVTPEQQKQRIAEVLRENGRERLVRKGDAFLQEGDLWPEVETEVVQNVAQELVWL